MSGLVDKLSGAVDEKLNQESQPGDGVERAADGDVNQGLFHYSRLILLVHGWGWFSGIDQVANDIGAPQQDDNKINEVADRKVNEDIPLGND